MVSGDARARWNDALLRDPRVVHFWDEKRFIGRWFAQHADPPYPKDIAWDSYFLYGPMAHWDRAPSPLISWGRPVVDVRAKLQSDLGRALAGAAR